jgi:hypothetical protein
MQLGKIRQEYAGYQQNDAHELIELVLDKVKLDNDKSCITYLIYLLYIATRGFKQSKNKTIY